MLRSSLLGVICATQATLAGQQGPDYRNVLAAGLRCSPLTPDQVVALVNRIQWEPDPKKRFGEKRDAVKALLEVRALTTREDLERTRRYALWGYQAATLGRSSNKFRSWVQRKAVDLVDEIPVVTGIAGLAIDIKEWSSDKLLGAVQSKLFDAYVDPEKVREKLIEIAKPQTDEERRFLGDYVLHQSVRKSSAFKKLNAEDKDRFLMSVTRMLYEANERQQLDINRLGKRGETNTAAIKALAERAIKLETALSNIGTSVGKLATDQAVLYGKYEALAGRVSRNVKLIEDNRAKIKQNTSDIGANRKRIQQNHALISANRRAISFLKGGVYSSLPTKEKIKWLESGFYDLGGADVESALKELRLDDVKEAQLAFLNGVSKHANTVQAASVLLQRAGLGGDAPQVIADMANYATKVSNLASSFVSGNYAGAINSLTGMLFGSTDVAAQRHAQLVGLIQQNTQLLKQVLKNQQIIIRALVEIQKTLARIEQKIDRYHSETMMELFYLDIRGAYNAESLKELLGEGLESARVFLTAMEECRDYGEMIGAWAVNADSFVDGVKALDRAAGRQGTSNYFRLTAGMDGLRFEKEVYQGCLLSIYQSIVEKAVPVRWANAVLTSPSGNWREERERDQVDSTKTRFQSVPVDLLSARMLKPASVAFYGRLVLGYGRYDAFVARDGRLMLEDPSTLGSRLQQGFVRAVNRSNKKRIRRALELTNRCIAQESLIGGSLVLPWIATNLNDRRVKTLLEPKFGSATTELRSNLAHHIVASGLRSGQWKWTAYQMAHEAGDVEWMARIVFPKGKRPEGWRLITEIPEKAARTWKLEHEDGKQLLMPEPDAVLVGRLKLRRDLFDLLLLRAELERALTHLELAEQDPASLDIIKLLSIE